MPGNLEVLEGAEEGPLVLSYLNMLAFNEVVLVPVYASATREMENRAMDAIQRAFPEHYIIPISADVIALEGGTIHCVTQTFPNTARSG